MCPHAATVSSGLMYCIFPCSISVVCVPMQQQLSSGFMYCIFPCSISVVCVPMQQQLSSGPIYCIFPCSISVMCVPMQQQLSSGLMYCILFPCSINVVAASGECLRTVLASSKGASMLSKLEEEMENEAFLWCRYLQPFKPFKLPKRRKVMELLVASICSDLAILFFMSGFTFKSTNSCVVNL